MKKLIEKPNQTKQKLLIEAQANKGKKQETVKLQRPASVRNYSYPQYQRGKKKNCNAKVQPELGLWTKGLPVKAVEEEEWGVGPM